MTNKTSPQKSPLSAKTTRTIVLSAITLAGAFLAACMGGPVGRDVSTPLVTVPTVDLSRYLGRWYEVGRYEAAFQKGCRNVTATYSLRDDGKINVENACFRNGRTDVAMGVARIVDESHARLKVRFAPAFIPFAEGDYWIIGLDPDYRWAVVGSPSGRYLWLLSREAHPDTISWAAIMGAVSAAGYDQGRIIRTQD